MEIELLSRSKILIDFSSNWQTFIAGFPQYLLYRSLGECLVQESPPKDDCQSVLTVVWNYIKSLKDPNKFMHCTEIWIQFTVIHFSVKELNLFLGEIINKLSPNRSFEQYYPQLQAIVERIVSHTQDFESLLTMVCSKRSVENSNLREFSLKWKEKYIVRINFSILCNYCRKTFCL